MSTRDPLVAFLTDFGLTDGYVAVMQAVVLGIMPSVRFINITHDIPPMQVAVGAWMLAECYRYFPASTIFVCVVDPGVGSARRPLALHAGDWCFVGPDNGLFTYIMEQQPVHAAVALQNPTYQREHVSSTFHGRDIFAPVAAHLANSVPLADLGPPLHPATLVCLQSLLVRRIDQCLYGVVVYIDHFGNLITNIPLELVPRAV